MTCNNTFFLDGEGGGERMTETEEGFAVRVRDIRNKDIRGADGARHIVTQMVPVPTSATGTMFGMDDLKHTYGIAQEYRYDAENILLPSWTQDEGRGC